MSPNVLLFNAGSSSLRCTLMDASTRAVVARASADWAGDITHYEYTKPGEQRVKKDVTFRLHAVAAGHMIEDLSPASVIAVGHRVVHGGEFHASVRVTPDVRARISALAELAPLHNPPSLDTLETAERLMPAVPHIAVFDTAFHSTIPAAAHTYAVPASWNVRRYGFHGLSHAYCAGRARELLAREDRRSSRLVICHLGHGCSATAVLDGRSVDTTMGFTPLDGLMMATRSGSVDPGIVTHVQLRHGFEARAVDDALNHDSGLLGVSGLSGDMRVVTKAAAEGNERARLAIDVYTHRVRQAIGAFTVTLGGIDALVFTAGVGENAADIRADICRGLECLGAEIDTAANARCRPDADVAQPKSRVRIFVLATREDLAMLFEVTTALGGKS